jgi:hypothetical protein
VPQLAEGTEFAGCRIEAVVGRGGMGVVYRATQLELGRPVALKLLAAERAADPEFRARFQREWRMAAAIDHPNIIPVYAAGQEGGRLYLVLRYVAGADLHALLRAHGPLAPERATALIGQVASALDAAHRAGLVHRDVKPANVLLDGDHVYLSDFGLTRRVDGAASELTQVGRWMGTVDYASPEQLEGRGCDARSDVYSLGCVLHAALTGAPPYPRDTVPATILAHLHEPPPRPSDAVTGLPRGLDRVVARALAKDPGERYPSAGDLARAAAGAARGEPVTESERSVARGDAAPGPDTTAAPERPAPGPAPPTSATRLLPTRPGDVRVRRGATRALKVTAAVLVAAAIALGASLVLGGGEDPPTGPVSESDVREVVERFARAFADEDGEALRWTLTRDAERVLPGARQRGRDSVVEEYRRQFAGMAVEDYELEDLEVNGGDVGRAAGRYVVSRSGGPSFGGDIVFTVVRESARPRIDLIAARPEA